MKMMIASDIHGSAYYCRKLVEAFQREQPGRLLLLGDILYHGPRNDLPKDYHPKEVIRMLNDIKEYILCVRGNCDTEVDQMVLEFPIMAEYCVIESDGIVMYATHGHCYNPTHPPMLREGDILLNGHTHIPAKEDCGKFYYLNPGSVSLPKENSVYSYMVYENRHFIWKDFNGKAYQELRY